MAFPALPTLGDRNWYPWATGVHDVASVITTSVVDAATYADKSVNAAGHFAGLLAGGGRIVVPDGVYDVSGLAVTISAATRLVGNSSKAVLDFGGQGNGTHLTAAAALSVSGLTVRNAGRFVSLAASTVVPLVDIDRCTFSSTGSVIYSLATSGENLTSLRFTGNDVNGTSEAALQVRPYTFGYAFVAGNTFFNTVRAAVLLGNGEDDSTVAQSARGRYVVQGNRIKAVTGSSDANGIQVFGEGATITGNHIENTASSDNTDCEGIYTKVLGATIMGNVLLDAGSPQGGICLKGVPRGAPAQGVQAYGYANLVTGNVVRYSPALTRSAAGIFADVGDLRISSNWIEFSTFNSIHITGTYQKDRVHISGNTIYNCRGAIGINDSAFGGDHVIDSNSVFGVTNDFQSSTAPAGILIRPDVDANNAHTALVRLSVVGNRISNVSNAASGSISRGIQFQTTTGTITGVQLTDNFITGTSMNRGVDVSVSDAFSDAFIDGNVTRVSVPTNGLGSITNLAYGTNSWTASGGAITGGASRPTITGSRGGNAALASLLTNLASMGLITDTTTT